MSHKKYTVGASTTNIGEDEAGNVAAEAIMTAVVQRKDVSEAVLDALFNCLGTKANLGFKWATNNYSKGLPRLDDLELQPDEPAVISVLETIEGQDIILYLCDLDFITPDIQAKRYLLTTRGWVQGTDEITSPPPLSPEPYPGEKVYMQFYTITENPPEGNEDHVPGGHDELEITYQYQAHELDEITGDPKYDPITGDPVLYTETDTEHYHLNDEGAEFHTDGGEDPLALLDAELFYQAVYKLADAQGKPTGEFKYFTYYTGDDTYPTLNIPPPLNLSNNAFFPIIPVRRHNITLTKEYDPQHYTEATKYMKYFGMTYQALVDGVNDTPDLGKIDTSNFYLAVDIQGGSRATIEYLFRWFEHMERYSVSSKFDYDQWVIYRQTGQTPNVGYVPRSRPPTTHIRFRDNTDEFQISWHYIEIERDLPMQQDTFEDARQRWRRVTDLRNPDIITYSDPNGNNISLTEYVDVLQLRRWTSPTTYDEINVHGLQHLNWAFAGRWVITSLPDSLSETNNNFIFPVHYTVWKEMGMIRRNQMVLESFKLVTTSWVKNPKKKWYQRGVFKKLLEIVAIVITIYTGFVGIQAILGAATLQAGLTAALTVVGKAILVSEIFSAVAQELGIELAFVLAVIATVIGGFQGATKGMGTDTWAENLLQMANGLTKGIQESLQIAIDDLMDDIRAFNKKAAALVEELEEAEKLLNTDSFIDPMAFIGSEPIAIMGESPTDFFARHQRGNVGVLAFDALHNFHTNALRLPRPIDTIGDMGYDRLDFS